MAMAESLQRVGEQPSELSVEDRNLRSVAYGSVAGSRRAAWCIIASVEQKENLEADDAKHSPQIVLQDRTLQCTAEQILDVLVPEMAEQLVEVPETVSQDRIQQRTVEQIVDAPVPQAVEELAEVFRVLSQDRIQQGTVEQTIPATSLAEMIVEVPVIQTQGRTQQGVNMCVQHVVNAVKVEKSEIIEETVQRMKLVVQEKINQETKRIESPPLQFMYKAVDTPVVAQRQIFMFRRVLRFHSCNTVMRRSMSLLCRSCRFHACVP